MTILLIAVGGFIGSILRFHISIKTKKHLLGTWIANVTGSIFLACVFHFYISGTISSAIWHFLGAGFSGAYTTFSTFSNETLLLLLEKKYVAAMKYIVLTIGTSLLLVSGLLFLFSKLA